MRSMSLILAAAILSSCSTAPPPPDAPLTAAAQAQLDRYLGGKVAGAPVSCLPTFRADDMIVVNERTVLFRAGSNLVYRNDFAGGSCPGLGWGHNALVFRSLGTSQLCAGEVGQVIDATTGVMAGSCVLGPFIPYRTPGS